jgi:2-amino-4-hydroxy-6-hydroxymethyldihydropteridine diphosphokinase
MPIKQIPRMNFGEFLFEQLPDAKPWHNGQVQKTVYLSMGSNLGDRETNLRDAIVKLGELGEVTAVSSFYETEPVEFTQQPWFLNCAVELQTEKMPRQLLTAMLKIEQEMGRKRLQPKGPRLIDIDILLFGNLVVNDPKLTIPHPAMHERKFVLEPLVEIAPDARHPVLKKSIRELRDQLPSGPPVVRRLATNGANR